LGFLNSKTVPSGTVISAGISGFPLGLAADFGGESGSSEANGASLAGSSGAWVCGTYIGGRIGLFEASGTDAALGSGFSSSTAGSASSAIEVSGTKGSS